MKYFDDHGRPYVEADKRIRMELLRLLSGLSDSDYKFRTCARRYCVEVWRLEPWQFRLAVLEDLQGSCKVFKKYANDSKLFLEGKYEMNVRMKNARQAVNGRVYVEFCLENNFLYIGAHNHDNTTNLPY